MLVWVCVCVCWWWWSEFHLKILGIGFFSPDHYLFYPWSEFLMESVALHTRLMVPAPRASFRRVFLANRLEQG